MVKHLCKAVGCGRVVETKGTYCELHQYKQRADDERKARWLGGKQEKYLKGWNALYNTQRWRNLREAVLQEEPFCRWCGREATVVDHIVPHRGNEDLFYDRDNLQPLCAECHKDKTIAEMAERRR